MKIVTNLLLMLELFLLASVTFVIACVDARPSPSVASDVLLICGQATRPAVSPMPTYVLVGDAWMAMMTERDFDLVMVDQDLLVGWQKCVTESIALLR